MARKDGHGGYVESEELKSGTIVLHYYEREPQKYTDDQGRVHTIDTVRGVHRVERGDVRVELPLRYPPEPVFLPAGDVPPAEGPALYYDAQAVHDAEAADAAAWREAAARAASAGARRTRAAARRDSIRVLLERSSRRPSAAQLARRLAAAPEHYGHVNAKGRPWSDRTIRGDLAAIDEMAREE